MRTSILRLSLVSLVGLLACSQIACTMGPGYAYRQNQFRAAHLHNQRAQAMQHDSLLAENQRLQKQASSYHAQLDTANDRLDNLKTGNTQLQNRYTSLLNRSKNQHSPLSESATRRFEKLAEKYPDFEFDPHTGVSKFHSDILFTSGSAHIKKSAHGLLHDFAKIMNSPDAKRLNILVVGHTDDRRIAKRSTHAKHPTNWHLSTNRANSVVLQLAHAGVKQNRMGVAGYSMYQPIVPNKNAKSRQQNRRVEIFVLAPDAVVAGWDPAPIHH